MNGLVRAYKSCRSAYEFVDSIRRSYSVPTADSSPFSIMCQVFGPAAKLEKLFKRHSISQVYTFNGSPYERVLRCWYKNELICIQSVAMPLTHSSVATRNTHFFMRVHSTFECHNCAILPHTPCRRRAASSRFRARE